MVYSSYGISQIFLRESKNDVTFFKSNNFCAYHLHTTHFYILLIGTKKKRGNQHLVFSFGIITNVTFFTSFRSLYLFYPEKIILSITLFRQNSLQILSSSRFFNLRNLLWGTSRNNISTFYSTFGS